MFYPSWAFSLSIAIFCSTLVNSKFNKHNEIPCEFMPSCKCDVREYSPELTYSDIQCTNQTTFPRFNVSKVGHMSLHIDGHFDRIPSGTFDNFRDVRRLQFLGITGTNDSKVTIEPLAFNVRTRIISIGNFDHVIIKSRAFENTDVTSFHLSNIKSLDFEARPFNGLNVSLILIQDTNLNNIRPSTFDGLRFSTVLDPSVSLVNTHLKLIPMFVHIGPQIVILKLTRNMIAEIDPVSATKLFSMEDFILDENPVKNFKNLMSYNETLRTFSCSKCSLTEIPQEIGALENLEELRLHSNQISKIPLHVFDKLVKLKFLVLSDNPIGKIKASSFSGIKNSNMFYGFDCDNCQLEEIPTSVSTHPKLTILSLNGNKIKKIKNGDFNGTGSASEGPNDRLRLLLDDNQIDTIENNSMVGLKWSVLSLKNNLLTEFDMSLSGTLINSDFLGLSGNRQLKKVYLTDEKKHPEELAKIDLSNSGVEEIDRSVFNFTIGRLGKVDLSNVTNFNCSKDLRWMAKCYLCDVDEAKEACNNIFFTLEGTRCSGSENELLTTFWNHTYLEIVKKCRSSLVY